MENTDSVMMQEVLLGGHLYQKVVKDRVHRSLVGLMIQIKKLSEDDANFSATYAKIKKMPISKCDAAIRNFLSTGNLTNSSGLGVPQNAGLVIIAENINRMRYMAHFRYVYSSNRIYLRYSIET